MKRLAVLVSLTLLAIATADAMWVKLSNEELVDSSQLIISATLEEKDDIPVQLQGSLIRVLRIIRVYQGRPGGGQVYLKLPSREKPISSSDLVYPVGQKGIWFLKETEPGSGVDGGNMLGFSIVRCGGPRPHGCQSR